MTYVNLAKKLFTWFVNVPLFIIFVKDILKDVSLWNSLGVSIYKFKKNFNKLRVCFGFGTKKS